MLEEEGIGNGGVRITGIDGICQWTVDDTIIGECEGTMIVGMTQDDTVGKMKGGAVRRTVATPRTIGGEGMWRNGAGGPSRPTSACVIQLAVASSILSIISA